MSSSIKDFLDKFFDLCREYQQEIPPQKMAEVLREYADRLDGWRILADLGLITDKNFNLFEYEDNTSKAWEIIKSWNTSN